MKGNFLVLRLSALGDLVLVSPALEYLSRKGRVYLLTYPHFAPLYEGDPRLDGILTLPRRPSLHDLKEAARNVARLGVDVVFDLQVKPITLLLGRLLRSMGIEVVRTEKRSLQRRLHAWFGLPLRYEYVSRAHLRVVAGYFGETPPDIRPSLPKRPVPDGLPRPYVVLSPEASASLKEWPLSRFLSLGKRIRGRGMEVVWVGTRGEPRVDVGIDLRGKTDLKTFVGVIGGARAVVSNDSAAHHVAYALGVKGVVIMGPTAKAFGFIPEDPDVEVVERSLKCRPCSTNGSGRCMVGGRPCMDIGVEEVEVRLERIV